MVTSSEPQGPAIEAIGLRRTFGDLVAVDGIDLRIERGELFSLLGPNAAGKTTTLRMLSCLLRPSAGSAAILGHDVVRDSLEVKRVIAISPQETAIAEHLSARENLALMAGVHGIGRPVGRRRACELLGMETEGDLVLVAVVLALMAVFYVSLGLAAGALMTVSATTGAYTAVLLLTVFGGTWFDLDEIGGPVRTMAGYLPFAHAVDAMRAVLADGATFGDIAGDLVWVGAYTAGAVALAVAAITRRLRE